MGGRQPLSPQPHKQLAAAKKRCMFLLCCARVTTQLCSGNLNSSAQIVHKLREGGLAGTGNCAQA
jgi:hypothetical protein